MEITMTGPGDKLRAEDAALWRRFRAAQGESPLQGKDLPGGTVTLAAYADGRLGEAEAERVETWLIANPEACADLAVLRDLTPAEPSQALLDRAMALVAASSTEAPAPSNDGNVLPFRRPAAASAAWRLGMARFAVAASLLLTGLVGFAMGSNVYASLLGVSDSGSEVFDQPLGVFGGEDSTI
jgi:anti-sigma factor RsiW